MNADIEHRLVDDFRDFGYLFDKIKKGVHILHEKSAH